MPIETITLITKTPIWTGGSSNTSDRIHTTGLLGSLRWWYESLIRGVGGAVSDPTGNTRSLYNEDAENKGLCEVSKVFGATGYSKRFRLDVDDKLMVEEYEIGRTNYNDVNHKQTFRFENPERGRPSTWFLNSPSRAGQLKLKIVPLYNGFNSTTSFDPTIISGLLQFIARWGSLGAKPQMGMGVFGPDRRFPTTALFEQLTASSQIPGPTRQDLSLPSLTNMFFGQLQINIPPRDRNPSWLKTFELKYNLRRQFADNRAVRHFIMGTTSGEKQGAKVFLSLPYLENRTNIIRIWGWVPQEGWGLQGPDRSLHLTREAIMKRIYNFFIENGLDKSSWREFGSPSRDSNKYTDGLSFAKSLMD